VGLYIIRSDVPTDIMYRKSVLRTVMIGVSMFHRAFFNSIIDKHQHMHFFTLLV